jgi:KipI family sensor histidine kinase inhibitor
MRHEPGVVEVIPTFRSLLVIIDPLAADRARLTATALELSQQLPPDPAGSSRLLEVPVVYGGTAGPDLADVGQLCGLTANEIIERHSRQDYMVFMLGFAPGFPYLGMVPEALRVSRLPTPRTRVPAGSVAIADAISGIYPLSTPGGWRLIGRTPLILYDPRNPAPILLGPGDRVRFIPVRSATFPEVPLGAQPVTLIGRPALEVRDAGLYTTVQDLGRSGSRSLGMPPAGAMDPAALQLANLLAGNSTAAAAIECTAPGPVLRMLDDLTIAVTGADLSAALDDAELPLWQPLAVRAGQTLSFGAPRRGMWAYLAVAGGVAVPTVLGSAATYVRGGLGGTAGRRLRAGDVLGRREERTRSTAPVAVSLEIPAQEAVVRVIPGPQDTWFDADTRERFWQAVFSISVHSDRAGTRLEGPAVPARRAEMLSDGMLPGAVQVPASGQPIVIMPDGPTTGGYPKLGVVASADLRLVAQARPGTQIRFVPSTVADATDALRSWSSAVADLERGESP